MAERDGLAGRIDLIDGTVGEAFGVMGGCVASPARMGDAIRSHAPGVGFTVSL